MSRFWPTAPQGHTFAKGNFFQLGGSGCVDAARNNQRSAAGHAPGNLQCRRHVLGRQCDDGQVGTRLRQIGQRAAGVDVDKGQHAGKALRTQGCVQALGQRGLGSGVVDATGKNNDGFRRKEGSEVMLVHAVLKVC